MLPLNNSGAIIMHQFCFAQSPLFIGVDHFQALAKNQKLTRVSAYIAEIVFSVGRLARVNLSELSRKRRGGGLRGEERFVVRRLAACNLY